MMFACCGARDSKTGAYLTVDVKKEKGQRASGKWQDIPELKAGEILIDVRFATISQKDKAAIEAGKGIGHTFSGEVRKVFPGITDYKKSDEVYGWGESANGSVSEWVIVQVAQLAKVPSGVNLETASALSILGSIGAHADANIGKDHVVHIQTTNKMVREVLEKIAKQKAAKIVDDKHTEKVDWYYHIGGTVNSLLDKAVGGISWIEGKAGLKFHDTKSAEAFAAAKKFVEAHPEYFKGVKPECVIKNKEQIENVIADIRDSKIEIAVIDVDVLEKIAEKKPEPTTPVVKTDTTKDTKTGTTGGNQ